MSTLLEQAIERIHAGDITTARSLLSQELKQNPRNERAWMATSYCVSDVNQKKYCFEKVLEINPSNEDARRELGKLSSPQIPLVQSPVSRTNQSAVPSPVPPSFKKQAKQTKSTNFSTVSMILIGGFGLIVCVLGIGAWALLKDRLLRNSVDIVNTENSPQCSSDIIQRFKSLQAVTGDSVSSTVELIWKDNRGCNDFLCENPEWSIEPQGANGCNINFSILVNGQKETVLMYYLDLSNFRAYAGTDINNLGAPSFGIRVSKTDANDYLDLSK